MNSGKQYISKMISVVNNVGNQTPDWAEQFYKETMREPSEESPERCHNADRWWSNDWRKEKQK